MQVFRGVFRGEGGRNQGRFTRKKEKERERRDGRKGACGKGGGAERDSVS